ncbi:hypothetical protein [Caulobacter sp. X]|uniref:hypothetical protein n=1 Tax=Caulobacter sp. X TaxID=2048901 RepID=UPI000C1510EA|nr:hypothetical protein [Caulobacter sp. X]PIB96074.1 hypothetical protein CSW60_16110 [Caulobacter sp. X]
MTHHDDTPPAGLRVVSNDENDLGPRGLSVEAQRTLRQLERRARSGQLEAVNIRDVQQLASLGLARHGRGGWLPTREGLAYLEQRHGDRPADDTPRP